MKSCPDFSELEYADARFDGLKCRQTEIRNVEFYDCFFTSCSFQEAAFQACKFEECVFEECDLSLMTITNSIFSGVTFQRCHMVGINWTVANWSRLGLSESLKFRECAISHSSFMGLRLKKCVFHKCVAENVDFADADLSEADCTHSNFLSARFNQTNLTQANFENAQNYTIDVHENRLQKTRFSLPEAVSLLDSLDIVLSDE